MGENTDCLFALAPLLWLSRTSGARKWRDVAEAVTIKTKSYRRNILVWFANGFFFWFATLSWMPAIVKNGGPWPLVVLGWGLLSAYCALYFAAFGWLSARYWTWVMGGSADGIRRRGYMWRLAGILLVEPVLWAGLEIVRSRLLGGFSWNQLGVAPVNCGFGAPAALGGVYLVSALVVLVNGTLASVAERMLDTATPHSRKWLRSIETLAPLMIVWGLYSLAGRFITVIDTDGSDTEAENRGPLRVALVQRNFPCVFDRERAAREDPLMEYSRLLSSVSHIRPSLVVLPESALCEFGLVDSPVSERLAAWIADRTGASSVLAGGGRSADGCVYNSAALYSPGTDGSAALQCYDKVHLVPFGEYIPGDKLIPALQRFAPVGSCTPGELKTLSLPDGTRIGVAICFEDTDSAQMRRLAEMGAQVLVFITNDSWFSHSKETEQHAWQCVARAIETGLPVVRSGNSGVTGSVTPDGRVSWLSDVSGHPIVDAAATMCDQIVRGGVRSTPYVKLGDKPLFIAFLSVLIFIAATGKDRKAFHASDFVILQKKEAEP